MSLLCIYTDDDCLSTISLLHLKKTGRRNAFRGRNALYKSKLLLLLTLSSGFAHAYHECDEGQEHRDHDAANDDGETDDHDRFE